MPITRSRTREQHSAGTNNVVSSTSAHRKQQTDQPKDISEQFITNDATWIERKKKIYKSGPDEPPTFTINLTLPPEQRYLEVCTALKPEITNITSLFDEVVGPMLYFLPLSWVHLICRLLLRRIHNVEENAELRGISIATGVSMYLLVCFNVLLDLFMGCSSGGAAVSDDGDETGNESGKTTGLGWKMLHFRSLDWGMPSLRQIVVRLDFVTEEGGPVVARCVTYAGFVGVLTGVREGLSMSLNFRPTRKDKGKRRADWRYGWHLAMVLLGRRPSIASVLRGYLLPQRSEKGEWITTDFRGVLGQVLGFDWRRQRSTDKPLVSTPCYLCFSDGEETTVIEKDLETSEVSGNCDFIVITNNDEKDPTPDTTDVENSVLASAVAEIVADGKDRKECAQHNWQSMQKARASENGIDLARASTQDKRQLLRTDDVIELVQRFPTTNETTHYACVMDPVQGTIRWCRRWQRPITANWIRVHQSVAR